MPQRNGKGYGKGSSRFAQDAATTVRRGRGTRALQEPAPRWHWRPRRGPPVDDGWICERCQYRWSVQSRFCHSPLCIALMTPALTPLGELARLQLYVDDATLIFENSNNYLSTSESAWPAEPEAELSPRHCSEPEVEPVDHGDHGRHSDHHTIGPPVTTPISPRDWYAAWQSERSTSADAY